MATCVSSSGPLLCDLRRTSLWWPQQKGYRRIQQRDRFAYVPSLQVRAARKRQTSKVHGRRVLCQNHQVCAAWPSCRRQPILRCSITCPRPARQGLDGPSRPSQFLMQSDGNGKRVFAADRRRLIHAQLLACFRQHFTRLQKYILCTRALLAKPAKPLSGAEFPRWATEGTG
jgi:hypothetical protein